MLSLETASQRAVKEGTSLVKSARLIAAEKSRIEKLRACSAGSLEVRHAYGRGETAWLCDPFYAGVLLRVQRKQTGCLTGRPTSHRESSVSRSGRVARPRVVSWVVHLVNDKIQLSSIHQGPAVDTRGIDCICRPTVLPHQPAEIS